MTYRKKLIEVALPLDTINAESAREKSIRHGHPSTLHLWWARRPLATCRAVIFSSLVDDPSAHPEQFPTEEAQVAERERLFRIIRELVKWENSNNKTVLGAARAEIMRSTDGNPPPLLDPFCGGGSIPLEAQRLGLEAYGSDLNPVAVLITKALIEIPPKFSGCAPVNPVAHAKVGAGQGWIGARGLAEDVRYYGAWMRDEAQNRIGHLYPKVQLPKEQGGGEATVIAWLWARTVQCPNPVCRARMPLVRSFALSTKPGKKAWVDPVIDRTERTVAFTVHTGAETAPEGTVNRQGATCIVCNTAVPFTHIRAEGKAGRMGEQLMAVVAEGQRGRVYVAPSSEQEALATGPQSDWEPDGEISHWPGRTNVVEYGMTTWSSLFTPRQLVALTIFSGLAGEARERARQDALAAGLSDAGAPLAKGGMGATAYGDAVATYLAFAIDRLAEAGCNAARWQNTGDKIAGVFSRQAIPMVWDFAEANPFSSSTRNFADAIEWVVESIEHVPAVGHGAVDQRSAVVPSDSKNYIVSTDPPYYDNISYADLSDFFYVWLRHSLNKVYPDLFRTMLVPKAQELIASPYRFEGSKQRAQQFFEHGLSEAFVTMRAEADPAYPVTVYYAFKQAESEGDDGKGGASVTASTGWETMLTGLINAGFAITGTWPMRSERGGRMNDVGANALASSIVLVCRPRPAEAPRTTRRDFISALKRELPQALRELQHGNIAPVDLAQATIGPGMAVYSRYSRVIEADGTPLGVRTALQLINAALDEVLAEQEGEFDADTRWALAWFEQVGTGDGPYGVAEILSKAKNTSVAGLVEAGLLAARGGKVRLLRRDELPADWDPATDRRLSVWETAQHLIRALEQDGEAGAATLLTRLGERGQVARDLAYRLYNLCERKGWAEEALAYNSLVIAWQGIGQVAIQQADASAVPHQQEMFM